MNRMLWPSLAAIRTNLSGLSVASIEGQDYTRESFSAPKTVELPSHIATLIKRKVASRASPQGNSLRPGQIFAIPPSTFPDGYRPQNAQFIALDFEDHRTGKWTVWAISPETDYAGWHDLVIPEEDNLDPAIGMVQCWNKSVLSIPIDAIPMGILTSDRLLAARALASDWDGNCVVRERVRPGHIALRNISGSIWALTGSPLGPGDSRIEYRQLYREVMIHLARFQSIEEENQLLSKMLASLRAFATDFGFHLQPTPWIIEAMGTDKPAEAWRLGDVADISLRVLTTKAVELRIRSKLSLPLKISLLHNGLLADTETLRSSDEEASFVITDDGTHGLQFSIGEAAPRLWNLP